jgi:hypothetical protein
LADKSAILEWQAASQQLNACWESFRFAVGHIENSALASVEQGQRKGTLGIVMRPI